MQTLITKPIRKILIANNDKSLKIRATLDEAGNEQSIDFAPALKLFCPWNNATWLITELDPQTNIAFGLADLGLGSPELGYIALDELIAYQHHCGLRIERDRYFDARSKLLGDFAKAAREAGYIAV